MTDMLTQRFSRCARVWAAAALTCCASSPAWAGDKLPTGAQVMDTFVKNSGGKAAYKRLKNRVQKARIESPQGAIKLTIYEAPPNKNYIEVETPMGMMKSGTDGDIVWRDSAMMGAQVVTGKEREQELQEAFFHNPLKWRQIYTDAVCKEITDFGGERCYKVLLTPKVGNEETRYFALDTGLQTGAVRTIDNPMMGKMELTIRYEDYKEVDGILYPCKIVRSIGGQEGAIVIEDVKHNVDLPKDRFAVPESIAKLIEEQKAEAKAATAKKSKDDGNKDNGK